MTGCEHPPVVLRPIPVLKEVVLAEAGYPSSWTSPSTASSVVVLACYFIISVILPIGDGRVGFE